MDFASIIIGYLLIGFVLSLPVAKAMFIQFGEPSLFFKAIGITTFVWPWVLKVTIQNSLRLKAMQTKIDSIWAE